MFHINKQINEVMLKIRKNILISAILVILNYLFTYTSIYLQ